MYNHYIYRRVDKACTTHSVALASNVIHWFVWIYILPRRSNMSLQIITPKLLLQIQEGLPLSDLLGYMIVKNRHNSGRTLPIVTLILLEISII